MENLHSRLSFWPVALLQFVFAVWCRPGQLQAPTIHLNQTVFPLRGRAWQVLLVMCFSNFLLHPQREQTMHMFFRGNCFEAVFVSFLHQISKTIPMKIREVIIFVELSLPWFGHLEQIFSPEKDHNQQLERCTLESLKGLENLANGFYFVALFLTFQILTLKYTYIWWCDSCVANGLL